MHVRRSHLSFVHFPDVEAVLNVNTTLWHYYYDPELMYDSKLIEHTKAKTLCKQLAKTWHPDKLSSQCTEVASAVYNAVQTVCKLRVRDKRAFDQLVWTWLKAEDVSSVMGKSGFKEAVAVAEETLGYV